MSIEEDYPEHAKMHAVKEKSQAIGEFLDNSPYVLAEYDCDDRLLPVSASIAEVLAEYFEIDLWKLETEKRQMLDEIRKANHA